ncbi:MAG: hypothetical protein NVS9B11_22640 [Candidatus Dormibacteraceae bacterium]
MLATFALEWLHILAAIIWVGSFVFLWVAVRPAVRSLPADTRTAVEIAVRHRAHPVILAAVLTTGATGWLRGTLFGPLRSVEAVVGTPYGLTFAAATAFGLLAFWPWKPAWLRSLWAEPIGFGGALTCMVLMHFGL